MTRICTLITLLLAITSTALAQSGRGPGAGRSGARGPSIGSVRAQIPVSLTFTQPAGIEAVTSAEISNFMGPVLEELPGAGITALGMGFQTDPAVSPLRGQESFQTISEISIGVAYPEDANEAAFTDKAVSIVRERFEKAVAGAAATPKDQRTARIKAIDERQKAINERTRAINLLLSSKSDLKALLSEKLQQLRLEAQRLEIERNGKETRRQALAHTIQDLQQRAQVARQDDAIIQEMRKLIVVRETDLAQRKAMFAAGSGTHPAEAEAALAEARIRLAEREASIGKAGKGELLDRLTDELAMVSVDTTDVELRLNQVKKELQLYSLDNMNPATLEQLMQHDPMLKSEGGTGGALELRDKLQSEYNELETQRLPLKVTAVTVTSPGPATILSRGGRRGRGAPPQTAPTTAENNQP